jgi:hypothetical protein
VGQDAVAPRYALFTLVGIAGGNDFDSPDLNGGLGRSLLLASHPVGGVGHELRVL